MPINQDRNPLPTKTTMLGENAIANARTKPIMNGEYVSNRRNGFGQVNIVICRIAQKAYQKRKTKKARSQTTAT